MIEQLVANHSDKPIPFPRFDASGKSIPAVTIGAHEVQPIPAAIWEQAKGSDEIANFLKNGKLVEVKSVPLSATPNETVVYE